VRRIAGLGRVRRPVESSDDSGEADRRLASDCGSWSESLSFRGVGPGVGGGTDNALGMAGDGSRVVASESMCGTRAALKRASGATLSVMARERVCTDVRGRARKMTMWITGQKRCSCPTVPGNGLPRISPQLLVECGGIKTTHPPRHQSWTMTFLTQCHGQHKCPAQSLVSILPCHLVSRQTLCMTRCA
jgi:hypothetical protein